MALTLRNAAQHLHYNDTAALQKPITRIESLVDTGLVDPEDTQALEKVAKRFSVAITPAMLSLIDPHDPDDPIARQFVPSAEELEITDLDLTDPIGDTAHSPVNGIVHRYPDRLLLMPVKVCPVYCRFCFRRETIGSKEQTLLSETELETTLEYIRAHDEVWEVILSGGDPLLLSSRRIGNIINALQAIEHVKVIRLHTRVPVVEPDRVSAELIAALAVEKAVYVVLHTNHPREIGSAAKAAIARLVDGGIPMLSQSVLLKGINDNVATLEQLLRTLVENRVKPYYLHHPDRAAGTDHFRISIGDGQKLVKELRGRVSGLCQPEYVLDIPGGHGKIPLGPQWVDKTETGFRVSDYRGTEHDYPEQIVATGQRVAGSE